MRILISADSAFHKSAKAVARELVFLGHNVVIPNDINKPNLKTDAIKQNKLAEFTQLAIYESREKIKRIDAMLVLNYDKRQNLDSDVIYTNHVDGAMLLEMYDVWRSEKPIFMLNPIPDNLIATEIASLEPIILNGRITDIPVELHQTEKKY